MMHIHAKHGCSIKYNGKGRVSMAGIYYDWRYCYSGNDGYSTSITYNFSRSTAVAQVSLSMADGDGLCVCGFTQYRHRPTAGGADKDVNYGWSQWYGYPPSVYDEHMTS